MKFKLYLFDNIDNQVYREEVEERNLNSILRNTKRKLEEGYVKINETDYLSVDYIKGFRILEIGEEE